MSYEWDETKRISNICKHGVDFEEVHRFEWSTAIIKQDTRCNYGELRIEAKGMIADRLHTLIFTIRNGGIRLIGLRKSNNREIKEYEQRDSPQTRLH